MTKALVIFACPRCGHDCDSARPIRVGTPPNIGDFGVCLRCGGPFEYCDGPPRWLTFEELVQLPGSLLRDLTRTICLAVTSRPSGVVALPVEDDEDKVKQTRKEIEPCP